jgi:hypothetical protein
MNFRYESKKLRSYNIFFIAIVNKKIGNILNRLDSRLLSLIKSYICDRIIMPFPL